MAKFFIFIDETGNNDQENFFGLGCLLVPVENIGEYYEILNKQFSKIVLQIKEKEKFLEKELPKDDLLKFLKGRRHPYEIKFKNINANIREQYKWILSKYFKFESVKFCGLIIDKEKYPNPKGMTHFDIYINRLVMLLKNNVSDKDEFVVLSDNISIPRGRNYEKELLIKLNRSNKKCFGVHRINSHSNLFLQMVDLLIGGIAYDFKDKNERSEHKNDILTYIKRKTGIGDFTNNVTKDNPNYFSVWIYQK